MKNKATGLKKNKEGCMGGIGRRKKKGEMQLYYNLK